MKCSARSCGAGLLTCLMALLPACSGGESRDAAGKVSMAVAASMTDAVSEAGNAFSEETGIRTDYEFGSSGALARKIESGAPFDVFVSANLKWVQYLKDKGRVAQNGAISIAGAELVCIVPEDSRKMPASASELIRMERVAMGDPEHVPAGAYARQALQNQGVWDALRDEDHMVLSQDVRAVLSLVQQGQVSAGIVYSTDAALSNNVKVAFSFPSGSHDPIEYYAATIVDGPDPQAGAKALDFMRGSKFREILSRYGFSIPR